MTNVTSDAFLPLAEPYALGALEDDDRASFESHLAGCSACRGAVENAAPAVLAVASALAPEPPRAELRTQLLDLAEAPRWPLDLWALTWEPFAPGIRIHVLKDEPERGVHKCLVWAEPGAQMARHRHGGDECILVLTGALRDERGVYRAGELCRSRQGSVHHEEVAGTEDCVCYVVYYGPLEFL